MRRLAWYGVLGCTILARMVHAGELSRERSVDPHGIRNHVASLLTENLAESTGVGMVSISRISQYAIVFWPMPDESIEVRFTRAKNPAWRLTPQKNTNPTVELLDEVQLEKQRRPLPHKFSHDVLKLWRQGVKRAQAGVQTTGRRDGTTYEFFAYALTAETHDPEDGVAAAMVALAEALREYVESGDEARFAERITQLKLAMSAPPVSAVTQP